MKQLPIVFPPIETYQAASFVLATMLGHTNMENVIYNKYIKVNCFDTDDIWGVELAFDDCLWDEYWKEGLTDVNLFNAYSLGKSTAVRFLEDRLDQGCYIILYHIDEYYLSHSRYYRENHFIHDIYIYGYDEESFMVMGYKGDKLQQFGLPKEEIIEAFFNMEQEEDKNFCTMRPCHNADVRVEYDYIIKTLKDYYSGRCELDDEKVHGMDTYRIIKNCLEAIKSGAHDKSMDIRVFRMLWEHKKLMSNRIRKLQEYFESSQLLEKAEECEKLANKLFMLSIKYRMLQSDMVLNQMISKLCEIESLEKSCGECFM